MEKNGKRILFITTYPESTSPSQRFRIELYKSLMKDYGFRAEISSFFSSEEYYIIYKSGYIFKKSIFVFKGLVDVFFNYSTSENMITSLF